MTVPFKKESEIEWETHSFMNEKAKVKWFFTPEEDDVPMTVMLVSFEKGLTGPDHVHRDHPDLAYVLKGKGTFFIDGVGEIPMEPGTTILVPPNTVHALRKVEEDLLVYHVYSPSIKKPGRKKGNDRD